MRTLIFKDKEIPQVEYDQMVEEYKVFLEGVGIKNVVIETTERSFAYYPVEMDSDQDARPAKGWCKEITDSVFKKYNSFGVDHVLLLIHEDNWRSSGVTYRRWLVTNGLTQGHTLAKKGIWGFNQSYVYQTYQVQYCRWDKDSIRSTFGTINHEQDHSYDVLCQVEAGVDLRKVLGVVNYDNNTTHGQPEAWHGYIRYKENENKLQYIAPYLNIAYAARRAKQEQIQKKMMTIISLARDLIYLLKVRLNKKDGVTRYL